jgi:hypothetical protein
MAKKLFSPRKKLAITTPSFSLDTHKALEETTAEFSQASSRYVPSLSYQSFPQMYFTAGVYHWVAEAYFLVHREAEMPI